MKAFFSLARPVAEPAVAEDRAGKTLFEILGVIVLSSIMSLILFGMLNEFMKQRVEQSAADHGLQVLKGATRYIQANRAALVTATVTNPVAVDFATLQADGFITPGVQNQNAYSQSYTLLVRQPTPNNLQGTLVTTGGNAIGDGRLPGLLARTRGAGGMIDSVTPTMIQGAFGGWQLPVATYAAAGVPITPGHLAFATEYAGTTVTSNWLSRIDTGNPLDRTMQADIIMNNNSMTGANQVTAVDVASTASGFRLNRSSQNQQFVGSGANITKPVCGSLTPVIAHMPSLYSDNATGNVLSAVQSYSIDNGADWTVRLRLRTASGYTEPSATFGQIVVTVSCQ